MDAVNRFGALRAPMGQCLHAIFQGGGGGARARAVPPPRARRAARRKKSTHHMSEILHVRISRPIYGAEFRPETHRRGDGSRIALATPARPDVPICHLAKFNARDLTRIGRHMTALFFAVNFAQRAWSFT